MEGEGRAVAMSAFVRHRVCVHGMNTATHVMDTAPGVYARGADAWTAFWADPDQSRCAAGAPEIWHVLTKHWSSFARALAPGTRILDLGCGACAVGRLLVGARFDLHVTGIDAAGIPLATYPRIAVLSHTAMEALPFTEPVFGAAVSQYGFEYSRTEVAAREIARVLAPGANLSFLVHHADSAIVAASARAWMPSTCSSARRRATRSVPVTLRRSAHSWLH